MGKKALFAVFALLLLPGCLMNLSVDQKIERSGSSDISMAIDFSPMVKYIEQAVRSSQAARERPDETYSPTSYADLPTFESQYLELVVSAQAGDAKLYPGSAAAFAATLTNYGGERISNATLEAKSRAVVGGRLGRLEEYVGSLERRESRLVGIRGAIADVPPGTYDLTFIITYDTPAKQSWRAAKTVTFTVIDSQQVIDEAMAKFQEQYARTCDEITAQDPQVACTYEANRLTMGRRLEPGGDYSFNKTEGFFETTYNVTITSVPAITAYRGNLTGSMGAGGAGRKFKEGLGTELSVSVADAARSAVSMEYTVSMPAKILSAPGGNISADGMSVKYDILRLYGEKRDIGITAREENEGNKGLALAAGAGLLMAFLAGIYLVYKKAREDY